MNATERALAQITAAFSGPTRKQRQDGDDRIVYLRAVVEAVDVPVFGDGMVGAASVFRSITDANSVRQARAGCLLRARIHQLDRCAIGVKKELARASVLRRSEVALARLDATLAAIDANRLVAA